MHDTLTLGDRRRVGQPRGFGLCQLFTAVVGVQDEVTLERSRVDSRNATAECAGCHHGLSRAEKLPRNRGGTDAGDERDCY